MLHSFLGWEDLEVIDPNAEGAATGTAQQDEGHNQAVRLEDFSIICTVHLDQELQHTNR